MSALAKVAPTTEECRECAGTGSTVPDCPLCTGYRSVRLKKAYRHGWKKGDLQEIEDDGYCACPQCYDEASSCMFCCGDCIVAPEINAQQRMRVLIFARHGFIPLVFRTDFRGNFIRDEEMYLLSREATADLREEGLIQWFCSVFGDELHLAPQGRDAASAAWKEYRALCRRWVSSERDRRVRIVKLKERSDV